MRRSFIPMLAAVFAIACADVPTTPLLTAPDASFERAPLPDNPPPPFAVLDASASTEYGDFNFVAHLFINKPGNVAWLQFHTSRTTGVTFSSNARIMSVNGDVSGVGTISIGGNTIHLSDIEEFEYATYRTTSSVSFGGGGITRGVAGKKFIGIEDGPAFCTIAITCSDKGGKGR